MSCRIDAVNKEMPGHTDTLNMAMYQMTDTNKHAPHSQMKINALIITLHVNVQGLHGAKLRILSIPA
jgi:ABC-type molybdate transport system permease subunit